MVAVGGAPAEAAAVVKRRFCADTSDVSEPHWSRPRTELLGHVDTQSTAHHTRKHAIQRSIIRRCAVANVLILCGNFSVAIGFIMDGSEESQRLKTVNLII